MSSSLLTAVFAQITSAASPVTTGTNAIPNGTDPASYPPQPWYTLPLYMLLFGAMIYFAFLRPQMNATKKKEETIRGAKTGDKIVTSSGIHGVITNVKETTVIVKVADNVKLEIEKTHIDKVTRESGASESDKAAAKA